ncbi:TPA: carboxymuconolactone decarboxylase family protein [Salmonella enterica]
MINRRKLSGLIVAGFFYLLYGVSSVNAQSDQTGAVQIPELSPQEVALVNISSNTATGNLQALDASFRSGLDAGLTINQIKSAVEQLYAYCGFPRSLNGISTLRTVIDSRQKQGVEDVVGQTYQPLTGGDRYERGRATLEELTGVIQYKPAPGFGEFSPEIDRFLKEHLFADIFDNKLLSYRERELVTISALASMSGVTSQLKSHVGIGKNTGITERQLEEISTIIVRTVNPPQANDMRQILRIPPLPN